MERPAALSEFLTAVHAALAPTEEASAKQAVERIFGALEQPALVHAAEPVAPPSELADQFSLALRSAATASAPIANLASAFEQLAPLLRWAPRPGSDTDPQFRRNHVNTAIVGPTGLEERSDVIVGAGLLNPRTHYPIHSHPPEELYVVMTDGEWYRDERQWYCPGVGGVVYHPPNMTHAMRSLDAPLLAVWCLYVSR